MYLSNELFPISGDNNIKNNVDIYFIKSEMHFFCRQKEKYPQKRWEKVVEFEVGKKARASKISFPLLKSRLYGKYSCITYNRSRASEGEGALGAESLQVHVPLLRLTPQ